MAKRSTFLDGYKPNFETLKVAFAREDIALMECQDAKTGEKVAVLCAVGWDGAEYNFVPFARMFDGNPYEQLIPPGIEGEG
jgi:hypothetical protein